MPGENGDAEKWLRSFADYRLHNAGRSINMLDAATAAQAGRSTTDGMPRGELIDDDIKCAVVLGRSPKEL